MANPTKEQLEAWYKDFSKLLYETANIDVRRKEDLGRIQNYVISDWGPQGPELPGQVDVHYAFIPRNENGYVVPEPDSRDFKAYSNWLLNNLTTEPTHDQLLTLYNQSREGTLMVNNPGEGTRHIRQVLTAPDGSVTISLPLSTYIDNRSNPSASPDQQLPLAPLPVDPPAPPAYVIPQKPAAPAAPENPNPGFWSWVGYLLGMDTDYAKLMQYQKEIASLPSRLTSWNQEMDALQPQIEAYKQSRAPYDAYLEEFEAYKKQPLAILSAAENGRYYSIIYAPNGEDDRLKKLKEDETAFLTEQHFKTPQGHLRKTLNAMNASLNRERFTETLIHNFMGPDAQHVQEWAAKGYYNPEKYHPVKYLTVDNPKISTPERLAELAPWVCFAALTLPSVSGYHQPDVFTQEEAAQLNFSHILNDIFTQGRKADQYMPYLEPAREVGMGAIYAYGEGNLQPAADLLARGIRQMNREAVNLFSYETSHALDTFYLADQLLSVVEKDPELLKATGLTEQELNETRANAAYHKLLQKAAQGKQLLMEYGLFQKELTPAQIQQAACDILFANTVISQVSSEIEGWENARFKDPAFQELAAEMTSTTGFMGIFARAEKARKEGAPNADQLQKEAEAMQLRHKIAAGKYSLSDLTCPGSKIREQLLSESWVKKSRDQLLGTDAMKQLASMDRESVAKLFTSNEDITRFFKPVAKKEPVISNDLVNSKNLDLSQGNPVQHLSSHL